MARVPSTGTLFQITMTGTPTNIPNTGVSGFGADKTILDASALEDAAKQFVDDVPDPGEVTTKVMLARPHIKKRWFMVVPCGQGAKTEDGKGE